MSAIEESLTELMQESFGKVSLSGQLPHHVMPEFHSRTITHIKLKVLGKSHPVLP